MIKGNNIHKPFSKKKKIVTITEIISNLQNNFVRESCIVIIISTEVRKQKLQKLNDLPNSYTANQHQNKGSE